MAFSPCPTPNGSVLPAASASGTPGVHHGVPGFRPHALGRIRGRHGLHHAGGHGAANPSIDPHFADIPEEPLAPDSGCLKRGPVVGRPSATAPLTTASVSKIAAFAGGAGLIAGGGAFGYGGGISHGGTTAGGSGSSGGGSAGGGSTGGGSTGGGPGGHSGSGGTPVPEPASIALFAAAVVALLFMRRWRAFNRAA